MAKQGTIELYTSKGTAQVHRFRVRAGNGEIVHTSEGYSTPSNRKRAAVRWNAANMGRYLLKDLTK